MPPLDTCDFEDWVTPAAEEGRAEKTGKKCSWNRVGVLDFASPKASLLLDPLRIPSIFFLGFLVLASYVIISA